jgi:hypothetical protein
MVAVGNVSASEIYGKSVSSAEVNAQMMSEAAHWHNLPNLEINLLTH